MFAGLVEVLFSIDLLSVRMKVVYDERKTACLGPGPVPEYLNLHAQSTEIHLLLVWSS
jgi:hypothetical protein